MIIHSNVKESIKKELVNAKSIWVASAMISYKGWLFLQQNLPKEASQNYLIGIDLATDPKVFEAIYTDTNLNARVYETKYTFHPKVYLIQKTDNSFTAFIGSSNTTNWGLEKNVEMNFQINDVAECQKLLVWFKNLYLKGHMIDQKFINEYKIKFKKAAGKAKEIEREINNIKAGFFNDGEMFFSKNQHEIFNGRYHRVNTPDIKKIRREVREKFLKLHQLIYPQFKAYGLSDLYSHHQSREIVSRHFFNPWSGNYINAMWLHYGKSLNHLKTYTTKDKSINKPDSFINNIRMQVIIHEDDIGIWLVLGRNNGSRKDREHFRQQMQNKVFQQKFFDALKKLGNEYWINVPDAPAIQNFKTPADLVKETNKETLEQYFIIGCNIHLQDKRLSTENISSTVLKEFSKLYLLYEMMRHV
ncbi:phospholipase D-like domain-containing protein [Flavobacterium sangjuense]|uniref:Phospholipase D-like domain-containing protein n=1 Tax=Flavobacterium sangjuense TaxID=2518177 RepID=A0A4P7PVX7_9FLAO|nr:phospholipase D-like domain-containing protein [Flavobacterium sangjuense]QBZ98865.1 hypothetical protein GS03_02377 [Flavobacterium sangjuense]